jgi:hypothetical protein
MDAEGCGSSGGGSPPGGGTTPVGGFGDPPSGGGYNPPSGGGDYNPPIGGGGGTGSPSNPTNNPPSEPNPNAPQGTTPVFTDIDGNPIIPDRGDNTIDVPEPPEIQITIDPSFANNAKAMCILNRLKEDEDLKSLLSDFANPSLGLNLNISLVDIPEQPGENIRGETTSDENLTSGQIQISMDSKDMGNSALEIAKSIAHEMIHAHINAAIFKQGGMANIGNLPGLADRYNSTKRNNKWDHNAAQHDYMGRYYHERLARIIQRYDATNGNQYDIAYYKALAWEGLKGSRYYSTLPSPVTNMRKNDYWENLSISIRAINYSTDNCN